MACMDASTINTAEPSTFERPRVSAPLRITIVSETYPPEVNGVALTLQRMLEGLRARRHVVQLVRLRQHADDLPQRARGFHEVLMRGVRIPLYGHLRMGVPCARALEQRWRM